jgi:hypothetical protein
LSFSYSGDPSNSPNDAVRFEVQDTINTNFLLADEEVAYAILQEAGTEPAGGYTMAQILSSAAHCCEALVRRFSMQADTQLGQLKITYSKMAVGFAQRAVELRLRAQGMQGPYVGGISESDKIGILSNPDYVRPSFTRDEFNNPWTGPQSGDLLDQSDLGPPLGT